MNGNRHILYLTTDGITDPLGQSQILPYLKKLAQANTITIISLEKLERLTKEKELQKQLSAGPLLWIPLTFYKYPAVFAPWWNLYRMKKRAKKLCRQRTVHIVHVRSYLAGLVGLSLIKSSNIKMLFDPRGFWIDERMEGNIWNTKNPIYSIAERYLRKKEISLYQQAHAVVLLTEKAKSYLLQHPMLKPKTTLVKVVPCCADEALFDPKALDKGKLENLKIKHAIKPADFLLSYHGSLGTWYKTNEAVDFFCALRTEKNNAKFLLITHDNSHSFKSYWQKQGLPLELLIYVQATREEVPYYLALSHLAVFFINPVFSKIASSPTKMAEIILMDIPFVTNPHIGDINELIGQTTLGKLVDGFTTDKYLSAIKEILSDTKPLGKNTLKHYFSLQRGVAIYQEVYTQLTDGDS